MFDEGQLFTLTTAITEQDAWQAAVLSQDTQPLHVDAAYAARTRFGRPIAPGILVLGRVAALLGTGLVDLRTHYIVTEQLSARFVRPVFVDDDLLVRVTVATWCQERGRLTVNVDVRNQRQRRVLAGTASLVVFPLAAPN